jgi:hypothetical protein
MNESASLNTPKYVRSWGRIITVGLLVVIIVTVIATHQREVQKLSSVHERVMQLGEIESHLTSIVSELKTTPPETMQAMQSLNVKVDAINHQLEDIKVATDQTQLRSIITGSTKQLSEQLQSLQKMTQSIKSRISPQNYLPVSALPFQVVGIDLWNGDLKATLRSGGQLSAPMGISEVKDGWRLMQLSTNPLQAVFQNSKGQKVLARVNV